MSRRLTLGALILLACCMSTGAETTDICEAQQATLNCGSSVINVVSANYGRTDSVTCISGRPANQISKTDCINPKTFQLVASMCNGKTSCSLVASNSVFSDPCFGTYKYLKVTYKCIPLISETTDICEAQQTTLNCGSSVINVVSANYGRTDSVTCISGRPANQISKTDCINPKTFQLVASMCNGKTSCSLVASNSVFSDPCFGTYKYLKVTYTCIPPISETTDICEAQQTTLNCGSSVINVVSANYGRTDSVTCISGHPANQISKTDCINPKTFQLVASMCNGKTSCSLVASNSVFSDPCFGTYKYLKVTYTCIPPISETTDICEAQQATLNCGSSVINVVSANYGRTDSVTCISGRPANQISKTDCINPKTFPLVASMCNGKTSCSLVASHHVFSDPCIGTYKYLNIAYTCIHPISETTDICEAQQATLNCGSSVINVVSANYGRTDSVTCISGRPANQFSKTDCINPKTFPLVASMCNGKTSCSLVASNSVFSDPCFGTYKYLKVAYTCIPPISETTDICEAQQTTLNCGSSVINVVSANYGRTDSVTCISGRPANQISKTDCINPKTFQLVASMCNGKTSCSLVASNSVFSDPCFGTYKYLKVTYTCIPPISETTDICEAQQATLNCGSSVINVVSANYGRTDSVTCISGRPANQISKTDCINPKTFPLVASMCNGKTSCSLVASHHVFSDPCIGTYKYLNIAYTCIHPISETTDICEAQQATLNCGSSVINVVSANYGRTDSVTCISGRPANQFSKTDCINPKTFPLVASMCNGKTSCSLVASNSVFSDPCFGTYKYLKVAYTCIPPISETTDICEAQQTTLNCGSSVINVVSANYGRTDSVTCISGRPANQISKTDCINPKTFPLVASMCNGKTSCSLVASHHVFSDPCIGTYKYLNIAYTCIHPISETTDICEAQQATLNCGSSVINVVSANYGRTDSVTCISGRPANQFSKTDCINPKTFPLVASICDGKTSCSLIASHYVFSDPCIGTYKYLNVAYTCIPPKTTNICEAQQATLNCGSSVINVVSANYGRTDSVTCISGRPANQISKTDCINPKTFPLVASMCNGKTSCSPVASHYVFSDPCIGTYKYLNVTYTCIPPMTTVICEGQTTSLNCGSSLIKVVSANYGRTDSVTCISGRPANQISKTDCIFSTTFQMVATICNGKTSCSLDASNSVFSDPCYGTYKYLDVTYICVPTMSIVA